MGKTNIEWTRGDDGTAGETWNPVTGCTRVSAGCDHCYAVQMTNRLEAMGQTAKYGGLTVLDKGGKRHFNGKVRTHDDALAIPLKWRKPRRVFVNSMSDLFHKNVPFDFIDKVFAVMALTPQHTYQILTKRPERMALYLLGAHERTQDEAIAKGWIIPGDGFCWRAWPWPLRNVWLGTSVENQEAADERIPHLLKCPAAVRFLSCEPLLGAVDLKPWLGFLPLPESAARYLEKMSGVPRLHWVIVGGESGGGSRRMDIWWARAIVEDCKAGGVACFVKQLGAKPIEYGPSDANPADVPLHRPGGGPLIDKKGGDPAEWPADLRVREFPSPSTHQPKEQR